MKRSPESRSSDSKVIPQIYKCLGKMGQRLLLDYSQGRHHRLVGIVVNPSGFNDPLSFFNAYQAASLLKKYEGLSSGINLSEVALKKFSDSEVACARINGKLSRLSGLSFYERSVFETARKEVKRILGKFSWDSALPYLSHGPGSSRGLRRVFGHAYHKYGNSHPSATGQCLMLFNSFKEYSQLAASYWEVSPLLMRSSKVITVPKDARGDRTICQEPLLNMYFQKGIGGLMRSRLARSGCNLNDQTINQRLACQGSIDGSLATIDLRSASDSVCRVLVERLLPPDWVAAMDVCRTHWAELPCGKEIFLQKFSSMGNGFTFELESLIFLALGRAVLSVEGKSGHTLSVYGDDIICPSSCADKLISILSSFGFQTNVEKSFVDGPFRESCGKHYFQGYDVTPFLLKKRIVGVEGLFYILNSIRRLAFRFAGSDYGLDSRFRTAWGFILELLPHRFRRFRIPEGYGDTGISTDFDEAVPFVRRAKAGLEGYYAKSLSRKYEKVKDLRGEFALLHKLRPVARNGELLPGGVKLTVQNGFSHSVPRVSLPLVYTVPSEKYKLVSVKILVPQWCTMGPWL